MKKFKIEFSELVHYETFTTEAKDADAAMEIFLSILKDGKVNIKDIETAHYDVKNENNTSVMSMSITEEQE